MTTNPTDPNPPTQPMSKRDVLASVGVSDTKSDRWVWQVTEIAHVSSGRCLLRKREFVRSTIVCIAGSALAVTAGATARLDAPFAIDNWCADERGCATMEVTAVTPCTLLLVNFEHREAVLHRASGIARYSAQTVQRLLRGEPESLDTSSSVVGPVSPANRLQIELA